MIGKLLSMNCHPQIVQFVHNFLLNRTQYVRMGDFKSQISTISTGAPQGCVLSPILFCFYTSDSVQGNEVCKVIKYADDTVIIGCVSDATVQSYTMFVERFSNGCIEYDLKLNISKAKRNNCRFQKVWKWPCEISNSKYWSRASWRIQIPGDSSYK